MRCHLVGMKIVALSVLFICFALGLNGQLIPDQYQLQVIHQGRLKRINIPMGQRLQFQVEGQDQWHEGLYWGAGPTQINISGDSLSPLAITRLRIPMKKEAAYWNSMIAQGMKKMAMTYAGMNIVNRPLKSWTAAKAAQVAITVAILWTGGKLMDKMRNRSYNCRNKWALRIRQPLKMIPSQEGQGRQEEGQR